MMSEEEKKHYLRMQAMMPSVVDFAREILSMQAELESLRMENEHLCAIKDDYFKVLNKSKTDSEKFIGNAISACLTPVERERDKSL